MYFFNAKSIVTAQAFENFTKDGKMQRNLYLFILGVLEKRERVIGRERREDTKGVMIEVAMHGVTLLMDVGGTNPELNKWLGDILGQVMRSDPIKG